MQLSKILYIVIVVVGVLIVNNSSANRPKTNQGPQKQPLKTYPPNVYNWWITLDLLHQTAAHPVSPQVVNTLSIPHQEVILRHARRVRKLQKKAMRAGNNMRAEMEYAAARESLVVACLTALHGEEKAQKAQV